jgi:hypothetical protein
MNKGGFLPDVAIFYYILKKNLKFSDFFINILALSNAFTIKVEICTYISLIKAGTAGMEVV